MKGVLILVFLFALTTASSTADFFSRLSDAAISLTGQKVKYDPAYVSIPYPNGDVPADKGVCTDVVIRAYRKLGIDLQKEVHEDMTAHFELYPKLWGSKRPDANIDHRRVQNLQVFFKRHNAALPVSYNPADYKSGDMVTWDLGGGVAHIGIVVKEISPDDRQRHLVVHNIGGGQILSDCLFHFRITGHYRYNKS
jgi:uncharacterized protein YijF (DUF1287 family)